MLTTYIHVVLRSRILGAQPSYLICVHIDKNKTIAYAGHLVYSYCPETECGHNRHSRHLVFSCLNSLVLSSLASVVPALVPSAEHVLFRTPHDVHHLVAGCNHTCDSGIHCNLNSQTASLQLICWLSHSKTCLGTASKDSRTWGSSPMAEQ
jgi:hypothetical protein